MTSYQQSIKEVLAGFGAIGDYDSRHVEAFMRLEHSTLDGLSQDRFTKEVIAATHCIDVGGAVLAEQVAQSFGL